MYMELAQTGKYIMTHLCKFLAAKDKCEKILKFFIIEQILSFFAMENLLNVNFPNMCNMCKNIYF